MRYLRSYRTVRRDSTLIMTGLSISENYTAELEKIYRQQNQNPESVALATLHSSKGLEYDNVYIIDVNEGIMPYKKAVLDK